MRLTALFCCVFALLLAMTGCGGGSNPIAVTLTPGAAQSAVAGQTVAISATVANDSKNAGVSWSLTGPGALSGQSATSVTYTAPSPISAAATTTITATSVSDSTKVATVTINLQPVSISLAPASPQSLDQAKTLALTATVSNDPNSKGVSWSLAGAGTLTGQTASAATYNAPASVTAASAATITATSIFDNTKTATFTLNLVPPPSVTTTSLAAGTVGVAYSASLAASNGVAPYSWSISTGALPGGLTLSGNTFSGTPTAYGTFNFTVQVKDAAGLTATANLSVKVAPAPVAISTTSLPNGIVNSAYSATLASTGGATPITWSVTLGSLPAGLTLNTATGAITGTPATAGTSTFTVQAADSSTPALTATKALSITIIPILSTTTTSLPNGVTSTAYSATLTSTGGSGSVTWTISTGTLPAGLNLNASTGAITGTPTTAGSSAFTVQAADSGTPQQKVTKALSITINQQLVITNTSLPTGAVSSNYTATLHYSGGTPAVTWAISAGALPGGLTLNVTTGAITGTPTASGTFNFTAQATDSGTPQQVVTQQLSIIVNPVLAITTTSPMPSGTVNTAYSQQVQTNGGGIVPLTWSITAGALPGGLTLNSSTGVISGKPTTTGTFNFTVQAVDSGTPQQTVSAALAISIATAPLSIATTGLPNGVNGQPYAGAVLQSAGGTPPVTWSISAGSLPSWASLNASTGAITGTPNAMGTTTFTGKATDSSTPTQNVTKQLSITVNAALAITSSPTLPGGQTGNSYSTTLTATGGSGAYTWSVTSGSLPAGLSLNSSTGAITGTPNAGGTFNFTIQVADSSSPQQAATQSASLTVSVTAPSITTTSNNLPQGNVNVAYPAVNLNATGGIQPYTWSITGGALPPGLSLSTSGAISGSPTTATGSPFSFTVQVADAETPTPQTATANLTITVSAIPPCTTGGSESMLNGHYAFVLKGFDNGLGSGETTPEPALIGGVLSFDGAGHISAGTIDLNENSTHGVQSNALTSGSYGITSDHRGCMVVTTAVGTQNFRFSLASISSGVASLGHVIDFDPAGPFVAGDLLKQSASIPTTLSGNFAFLLSSIQNTAPSAGGKSAAAGVFSLSGGSVTGGVMDFDDEGNLDGSSTCTNFSSCGPLSISGGGTYSIAANGRGTLAASVSGNSLPFVIYVVSSSEFLLLSSDDQAAAANLVFGGTALQQSGSLSNANLSGTDVFYLSSANGTLGGPGGTSTSIGTVAANGSGSVTVFFWQNNSGTLQCGPGTAPACSITASYSVGANGRTLLTGAGNHAPVLYLVSTNEAFMLGSDSSVVTGFLQPQTSKSASGSYAGGTIEPESPNAGDSEFVVTLSGGNVNGTEDDNSGGGPQLGKTIGPYSYSVDTSGLGLVPAGCSISGGTCNFIFYVISPTSAVGTDASGQNPKIQSLNQ